MESCAQDPQPVTDGEIQQATDEVKCYIRALKAEVDDFTKKDVTIKDNKELAELNESLNYLNLNLKCLLEGIKQKRLPLDLEDDTLKLWYDVTDLRVKYVATPESVKYDDSTILIE